MRILSFTVQNNRYGVSADVVVEIVRAVALTPLPGAPRVVEGVIDVRGAIVPVYDLRARFGLPARPPAPADHFVLVNTSSRVAALHVDLVLELVEVPDAAFSHTEHLPPAPQITGVASLPDGLVLIHDVDEFLSASESDTLDAALAD